jgi:hypothetical protein
MNCNKDCLKRLNKKNNSRIVKDYRSYLKTKMHECLNSTEYEEGVKDLFEFVITEFEAIVENYDQWITEAFQAALRRVKDSEVNKGAKSPGSTLMGLIKMGVTKRKDV